MTPFAQYSENISQLHVHSFPLYTIAKAINGSSAMEVLCFDQLQTS